jgi:DNA replicative helicase MCM subunit Mcm2 (Cdc46/Mcm family)
MKALKKDLQEVEKSLKQLVRKTEQMAKKLLKLEKAQSLKKPEGKAKAAKKVVPQKPAKVTATDTVLGIIKRSRTAVDIATLKKKTGFKDNRIRAILSNLKKKGKIKSERQGVYEKV